jgi:hypothetical protein
MVACVDPETSDGRAIAIDELMGELVEAIVDWIPHNPDPARTTIGDQFVAFLATRQLAAFQAVRILLLHGLQSEAAALVRRLFEDNMRLAWITTHPAEGAGLYYGHLEGQYQRKLREAEKLAEQGVEVSELLRRLRDEQDGIERARAEAGNPTPIGWLSIGQMTSQLGRDSEILMWVEMSPHVHSGVTSNPPMRSVDGRMVVTTTSHSLHNQRVITDYAGRYLAESVDLAANFLAWPRADRVSLFYQAWRDRLRVVDVTSG